MVGPAARREAVAHFQEDCGLSERTACKLAGQHRSVQQYRSIAKPMPGLVDRIKELAIERPRFGYRRIWVLLRREDWPVNHKRIYRLYRNLGPRRAAKAEKESLAGTARNGPCGINLQRLLVHGLLVGRHD